MNRDWGSVCRLPYIFVLPPDRRDRFLAKILNEVSGTEEGGAAWSSVKPEGDGSIGSIIIGGLDKDIVEFAG